MDKNKPRNKSWDLIMFSADWKNVEKLIGQCILALKTQVETKGVRSSMRPAYREFKNMLEVEYETNAIEARRAIRTLSELYLAIVVASKIGTKGTAHRRAEMAARIRTAEYGWMIRTLKGETNGPTV